MNGPWDKAVAKQLAHACADLSCGALCCNGRVSGSYSKVWILKNQATKQTFWGALWSSAVCTGPASVRSSPGDAYLPCNWLLLCLRGVVRQKPVSSLLELYMLGIKVRNQWTVADLEKTQKERKDEYLQPWVRPLACCLAEQTWPRHVPILTWDAPFLIRIMVCPL